LPGAQGGLFLLSLARISEGAPLFLRYATDMPTKLTVNVWPACESTHSWLFVSRDKSRGRLVLLRLLRALGIEFDLKKNLYSPKGDFQISFGYS
jgi:hypothetical protein